MNKKQIVILFLIFVLTLSNAFAKNESKVKRLLELTQLKVKTFSCLVVHISNSMGKQKIKKFILKVKQPDKIFIKYTYPKNYAGNIFIINGKTFINYFAAIKKVSKNTIKGTSEKDLLGMDLGLASKIFTDKNKTYKLKVEKEELCGNENCYVVSVITDNKNFIKQKFWLGSKSGLVKKLIISYNNQSDTFSFTDYKVNISLADKDFSEAVIPKTK